MIDELIKDFGRTRKSFTKKYNVEPSMFDIVLKDYVDDVYNGNDRYFSYPVYNPEGWDDLCMYFEERRTEYGYHGNYEN